MDTNVSAFRRIMEGDGKPRAPEREERRPNAPEREERRLNVPVSLVTAARSGDRPAVAELLRVAWPAGYRLARVMLGDPAAAEDVAQEACARALRALADLRDPDRFAAWFYRIVANEAKQHLRARAREIPLDTAHAERELADRDEGRARDDRIDVRRAIDALEPALRTTIVLRYYLGMSSAEIGGILQTSPVTARWRLMVAHRKLRALLEPHAASPSPIAQEPSR